MAQANAYQTKRRPPFAGHLRHAHAAGAPLAGESGRDARKTVLETSAHVEVHVSHNQNPGR